jgi:YebC/PmpR family DNA-binding regulatory protein
MSGHSKWANIKHRKESVDKKKGKIFSQMAKIITIAARSGGDPGMNPTLRLAVEKARAANMPNDNIERAIKKGTGEDKEGQLEEIVYEAFGPNGVPLIINVITDNTGPRLKSAIFYRSTMAELENQEQ